MAVDMTAGTNWGATVEQVSALAPQVTIGTDTTLTVDPVFYQADRRISVSEVEAWIGDVAGRVSLRLSGLSRITDTTRAATLGKAAHDAVVNGAASYLVAAAHPAGQTNDGSGYAALLWSRYESALDGAGAMLDSWLVEILAATDAPVHMVGGFFPAVLFPDGARF